MKCNPVYLTSTQEPIFNNFAARKIQNHCYATNRISTVCLVQNLLKQNAKLNVEHHYNTGPCQVILLLSTHIISAELIFKKKNLFKNFAGFT